MRRPCGGAVAVLERAVRLVEVEVRRRPSESRGGRALAAAAAAAAVRAAAAVAAVRVGARARRWADVARRAAVARVADEVLRRARLRRLTRSWRAPPCMLVDGSALSCCGSRARRRDVDLAVLAAPVAPLHLDDVVARVHRLPARGDASSTRLTTTRARARDVRAAPPGAP